MYWITLYMYWVYILDNTNMYWVYVSRDMDMYRGYVWGITNMYWVRLSNIYVQYICPIHITVVQYICTSALQDIYVPQYIWKYVLDICVGSHLYILGRTAYVLGICLGERLCYPIHIKRCCPIHMECCPRHIPNIYFAYPRHIWVKIRENPYMYWATPHMYLQCLLRCNVLGNIIHVLGMYIGVHCMYLG